MALLFFFFGWRYRRPEGLLHNRAQRHHLLRDPLFHLVRLLRQAVERTSNDGVYSDSVVRKKKEKGHSEMTNFDPSGAWLRIQIAREAERRRREHISPLWAVAAFLGFYFLLFLGGGT
jgi:hypothetical protein